MYITPPYIGPYTIAKSLDNNLYTLIENGEKSEDTWRVQHLKKFNEEDDQSPDAAQTPIA